MRRLSSLTAMLLVTAALGAGNASAAPTLTLEPACVQTPEGLSYAVDVGVTGLAPNAEFTGKLEFTYINPVVNPDGSYSTGGAYGPATFAADANGSFGPLRFGTIGVKTVYTATIDYAGQTLTKTVRVTCEPTTKAECKDGGWRDFGIFKNQGDCVSFVATKGKNPPGNG